MSTFESTRANTLGGALRMSPIAPARAVTVWDRFVTGSGLTVTLTAAVLVTVTWPIHEARWVDLAVPVPIAALLGLALAAVFVLKGLPPARAHLPALVVGAAFAFLVAVGLSPGSGVIGRTAALVRELAGWLAALRTDEVRAGLVEFGMLMTALAWLLGYGGGWLVLRRRLA